jgi:hypothetical protein
MTTTTAPPPSVRRETPARPRAPYTGLFREPVYADGRPYDVDDEDQGGPDDAG